MMELLVWLGLSAVFAGLCLFSYRLGVTAGITEEKARRAKQLNRFDFTPYGSVR